MIEDKKETEESEKNQKIEWNKIITLEILELLAFIIFLVGIWKTDICLDTKFSEKIKNLTDQNETKYDEDSLMTIYYMTQFNTSLPLIVSSTIVSLLAIVRSVCHNPYFV